MLYPINAIIDGVNNGDFLLLSKVITHLENKDAGTTDYIAQLPKTKIPVVGITGPPGAGKSTLIAGVVGALVGAGKKVAVVSVDPSSILHNGALLGDRIRMREWYLNPSVFIRSFASRGHLGGLIPTIGEIVKLLQCAGFDYVMLETVGVGQSEVQVVQFAYPTILVLVPEAGDDIQMMKSGLFEVANIFVVNKTDRPDAKKFINHLTQALSEKTNVKTHLVQTIANTGEGIPELVRVVNSYYED